jgi:hypothetical protein
MQQFSIVLKRILPDKIYEKCWWTITNCNQVKYKRITTSINNGVLYHYFVVYHLDNFKDINAKMYNKAVYNEITHDNKRIRVEPKELNKNNLVK